jgi:hypothetical protein
MVFGASARPIRFIPAAPRLAQDALKNGGKTMKDVFARLATDFFSTIVFLVIYLVTDNIGSRDRGGDRRRHRAGDL